ncbi:MAG: thioredoxin-dependent thiol peroxidase [Acidobacteriota bacterium]
MSKTLKPGDKAPQFETVDDQGRKVKLSDFKGKKVVLYFYPKDNTSGCTTQACLFRDHQPEIEAKNAVVLGVSPDSAASHQKFRSKYELPFNLLVDEDHSIAEAYGTWGEKSMSGKKYMGIVRSHFVIDEKGLILDAHYKVSPKDSAPEAIAKL